MLGAPKFWGLKPGAGMPLRLGMLEGGRLEGGRLVGGMFDGGMLEVGLNAPGWYLVGGGTLLGPVAPI